MKFGLISLGAISSKKILEEAKKLFTKVEHFDIKEMEVRTSSKEIAVLHKGRPLESFDCLYLRGSFRYALLQQSITRALYSEMYMPLKPSAFPLGHNKFLTLLELQKKKVPIPHTYFAATTKVAKALLEQVQYPIILKIPSGTQGKGVMFADSPSSATSMLDALEVFKQPYILQEYVDTNSTDIRAIVAGRKVIACMKRIALQDDLRANVHIGGKGVPYQLDYDTEQIAVRSAEAIGAEVCAVDILDAGGKPQVIEVNLSPGLSGVTEATKKNVAKDIAFFLYEQTKAFKEEVGRGDVNALLRELETESKRIEKKDILTNLDIKAGLIKLPKIVTDISQFKQDEDVSIEVKKGEIRIKKHEIKS